MLKNEKFTLTEKIFRQTNCLVTSLINTLLSRKFCKKKCDSKFLQFTHCAQCRNLQIFPHDFLQKFCQINFFTVKLYCKSIWRKIFEVGKNFRSYHTLYVHVHTYCGNYGILMPPFFSEKFRESNVSLKKNFTLNWFDGKICIPVNFSFFHTVDTGRSAQFNDFSPHHIFCKNSVNSTFSL